MELMELMNGAYEWSLCNPHAGAQAVTLGCIQARICYISPHSEIATSTRGRDAAPTGTFSTFRTTSMLSASSTRPNTTCLPSNQSALAVVTYHWQPFELGPLLACMKAV